MTRMFESDFIAYFEGNSSADYRGLIASEARLS